MMRLSQDEQEWARAFAGLPPDAVYVKTRGHRVTDPELRCGRLFAPVARMGQILSDEELYKWVTNSGVEEVVVIGTGVPRVSDKFIWKGSPKEFKDFWVGD